MMKQYNIRIDSTDIKEIDKLGGNRSEHIRNAITTYIERDTQNIYNSYNQELVKVLKDQVEDLKKDKNSLQQRLDYYTLP